MFHENTAQQRQQEASQQEQASLSSHQDRGVDATHRRDYHEFDCVRGQWEHSRRR